MTENNQNKNLDYKSLIEKVKENGDLLILGNKGTCKSTLLEHLARQLRADSQNHLIIIETFPKWIHEFDSIPYMIIGDQHVKPKDSKAYLEENKSYIQWSKDYDILNANEILEFLKTEKDCLFMVSCEDMESITAVMSFIIYAIYRRQYQRAFYGRLDRMKENFWFLIEESHNLLDSTTVQKKTFQKLRKEQNEFRNLRMHLICVALRLQDLNPKIRSKMSILLSRISLDDYQLKVRNLLRNSKFRNSITTLEKGSFVFPETDQKLTVQPFQQEGTPYEIKPPLPEQKLTKLQQEFKKANPVKKAVMLLSAIMFNNKLPKPKSQQQSNNSEMEDLSKEDSQLDLYMTEPKNGNEIFPEEF